MKPNEDSSNVVEENSGSKETPDKVPKEDLNGNIKKPSVNVVVSRMKGKTVNLLFPQLLDLTF